MRDCRDVEHLSFGLDGARMLREHRGRGEEHAGAGLPEDVFDLSWSRTFVDHCSHCAGGERTKIGGYRFRATLREYGDAVATLYPAMNERRCHRRCPIA